MGWMQRLSEGLTKTRSAVRGSLDRLLGRAVDPAVLEEFGAARMSSHPRGGGGPGGAPRRARRVRSRADFIGPRSAGCRARDEQAQRGLEGHRRLATPSRAEHLAADLGGGARSRSGPLLGIA